MTKLANSIKTFDRIVEPSVYDKTDITSMECIIVYDLFAR